MRPSLTRFSVLPRSSYYRPDQRQGAALIRARAPYLIRNIATGAGLMCFAMGVYAYTIWAIKTDEFEEAALPVPPPTNKEREVGENDY